MNLFSFLKIGRPEPGVIVMVATSCLHVLWVYWFVNRLEWLNFGMGVANTITTTIGCIAINIYLYRKARDLGFDPADFNITNVGSDYSSKFKTSSYTVGDSNSTLCTSVLSTKLIFPNVYQVCTSSEIF